MKADSAPGDDPGGWDEDRLKLRLKELLVQLTAIPGVSGFEDRGDERWRT